MPALRTTRHVLRAMVTKVRLSHLLRRLRGESLDHLNGSALQDRFAHIYKTRLWALGNPEVPGSGTGSTLDATASVRTKLPRLLKSIGTRSLLDVGCGDYNWMRTVGLEDIDYIGVDIVPSLIDENQQKYGSDHIRFVQSNAVSEPLPAADTVLIREVLFHLSFEDAMAVLRNVLSQPRDYLLVTTDNDIAFNVDIRSGDWRQLNLEAAPFKFPEPEHSIKESGAPYRRLAAWKADALRPLIVGR